MNFTDVLADIQAMQADRLADAEWEERQAHARYCEACNLYDKRLGSYSDVIHRQFEWHDKLGELCELREGML